MYQNPFIMERADPFVTKLSDGYYYFTASYPAYKTPENGYDRIILRRSRTVEGLRDAEEKTVWYAHKEGVMARHIWAPEIHEIGGRIYIFFAAANSDDVWHIRPYMLRLEGNNPVEDKWTELGRVKASEGDDVSFRSFSLDMTHLEHKGKHYLIWAEIIGDSSLFMAEINPEEPNVLVGKPMLLTKPEYDWEKIVYRVNEGPSILRTEDRIYVFFSASGTGAEYCMGMVYADINADLMNKESWTKHTEPMLQTEDLTGEAGPGHNSFVTDEKGELLCVYHARPDSHLKGECGTFWEESLYDPCRHTRIRKVRFDEKGTPILR